MRAPTTAIHSRAYGSPACVTALPGRWPGTTRIREAASTPRASPAAVADPVRQRGHRQDPRQPHLRQDRLAGPRAGDPLRLHPRLRRPGVVLTLAGHRAAPAEPVVGDVDLVGAPDATEAAAPVARGVGEDDAAPG